MEELNESDEHDERVVAMLSKYEEVIITGRCLRRDFAHGCTFKKTCKRKQDFMSFQNSCVDYKQCVLSHQLSV